MGSVESRFFVLRGYVTPPRRQDRACRPLIQRAHGAPPARPRRRLAAAGTYIPNAGATSLAAQITDSPGYYSLAGASAETIDPAGTWSAPARARRRWRPRGLIFRAQERRLLRRRSKTLPALTVSRAPAADFRAARILCPDEPAPVARRRTILAITHRNRGATAEILALTPTISGTVAGQSIASGQTDTPFSAVTIDDPNI